MDQISLQRINTLHPKIRKEVLELYTKANDLELGKGVRLRLSYTFRTYEEQDVLYAQGRTKPGKKVTNAKGGQSIHNFGLALDIVLMYDKDGISDWLEVTKVFTSAGYTNGFITNGKKWDLPHFQRDFGLSWKQMKSKIDKGDYTSETINGYTYKYINI